MSEVLVKCFFLVFLINRTIFTLPSSSLISKWTSAVEAEPGFLHTVLQAVTQYPNEERDVNIVIDAMSLKKAKLWNQSRGKFIGYPDYGEVDYGNLDFSVPQAQKKTKKGDNLATEVLVFQAVCLRGTWKLPIAYFFQNKITAKFQGELIKTAATLCHQKSIRVHSITFDGCRTNMATMNYLMKRRVLSLGSNAHFSHPCEGLPDIYIILDACHMVKLARNALRKI